MKHVTLQVVIMQEKLEQKDSEIKRLKDELEQKSIIVEEKIDPASDNGKSSDEVMVSGEANVSDNKDL